MSLPILCLTRSTTSRRAARVAEERRTAITFMLNAATLPGIFGTDWRTAALILGLLAALGLPIALLARTQPPATKSSSAVLRPSVLKHGPLLRTILAYSGHSWELYVSRGWLAACLVTFGWFIGRGRRDGSLEYAT